MRICVGKLGKLNPLLSVYMAISERRAPWRLGVAAKIIIPAEPQFEFRRNVDQQTSFSGRLHDLLDVASWIDLRELCTG